MVSIAVGESASFDRILLVDPDAESRAFYAGCLRGLAPQIDEAADGREALVRTVANRPSLMVTETRLPGFSGYELCDALRRHSDTADISIVVVTGDLTHDYLARAHNAGADAVLVKPCPSHLLVAEVRRLISRSRALRERAVQLRSRVAMQREKSDELHARSRRVLSRSFLRYGTSRPPTPPPNLVCPECGRALVYDRSHIGGVSEKQLEQWDYYECTAGCGDFQYRQRTRRVKRMQ